MAGPFVCQGMLLAPLALGVDPKAEMCFCGPLGPFVAVVVFQLVLLLLFFSPFLFNQCPSILSLFTQFYTNILYDDSCLTVFLESVKGNSLRNT